MKSVKVLGVKVNITSEQEVLETVEINVKSSRKIYIVTPNPEFLLLAEKDRGFKEILNNADISLADSPRLGWAYQVLTERNPIKRLLLWSLFLFPGLANTISSVNSRIPTLTGTDFSQYLLDKSSDLGFTIGFLGGKDQVAENLRERLLKVNPRLKILFVDSSAVISREGKTISSSSTKLLTEKSSGEKFLEIPSLDILFVALGQGKQEKWIDQNLKQQKVSVMIGVGGALDYLSGEVSRAPEFIREIGFEWLYRLILEPVRVTRQIKIFKFIWLVLMGKS